MQVSGGRRPSTFPEAHGKLGVMLLSDRLRGALGARETLLLPCSLLLAFGCGAGKDASGSDPLGGNDSGTGFHLDGGSDGGFSGDALDDGSAANPCPDDLKAIYVVSESNDFVRFDPATLSLTTIGRLNCPTGGGFSTPFSMAVDRKGYAWVLFNDGHLFHVSVKDASCTSTAYVPGQSGYQTFGMAYVSDAPGSSSETLYVAGYLGQGIAKIDTTSLKLSVVGNYGGASPGAGELTGTGEARMFAFFNQTPASVAEIDPKTSNILGQKPTAVTVGSGWAFAHWGGSFWLFTAPSGTSQIDQFDYAAGTDKTVKTGLPYIIVGAGVSTCAPTSPPK